MKSAHHAPNPGISRVCKKKKSATKHTVATRADRLHRQNIQLLQEQTDFTVGLFLVSGENGGGSGGGGGFFLACEYLGENVRPLIPHQRLFFFFLLFFKWKLARAH